MPSTDLRADAAWRGITVGQVQMFIEDDLVPVYKLPKSIVFSFKSENLTTAKEKLKKRGRSVLRDAGSWP